MINFLSKLFTSDYIINVHDLFSIINYVGDNWYEPKYQSIFKNSGINYTYKSYRLTLYGNIVYFKDIKIDGTGFVHMKVSDDDYIEVWRSSTGYICDGEGLWKSVLKTQYKEFIDAYKKCKLEIEHNKAVKQLTERIQKETERKLKCKETIKNLNDYYE